jgi:sulfate-transporting ATPase
VAAANWAIGCGIAAASFILLSSVTTIYVGQMTDLLLPVLAAALVGNFRSFGLTLAGGIGLGIIQTEVAYYSPSWGTAGFGLADTAPFIVILLLLVLRGRDLPLRDFFLQRQPGVGSGRVHPLVAIACAVVGVVVVFQGGGNWAAAWTTTFSIAIILLSIVLLTGYAGQISLAQFAIAGFGAWAGGRLVDVAHVPFLVALVVGIVAAAGLGTVMALPALRTRGVNLAILTLALGSGIEFMLFENSSYTGGVQGTILHDATHPSLNLFGWSIDGVAHPARYASVCVVALVLASWAVGNVRRGRSGRRLLAVRTNERAAAALGISVFSVKVYAFGLAAGLAGLGGVLLLFPSDTIDFSTISYSQSIILVALAVIGGVGYLLGPLLGSLLFVGAIGTQVTNQLFSASVAAWLQVFAGGVLILLILQEPDGMARAQYNQGAWIRARLRHLVEGSRERAGRARRGSVDQVKALGGIRERVAPKTLEVRAVSVRYGTVVAVDAVTLTARPGEILGLIGPNGAGKTSLIDVISGFAPAAGGAVLLDGRDITHWSPAKRARVGITRSFQSLELFDDMTVLDNLRTASDERDAWSYVTDLVHPVQAKLPQAVVTAVVEFGLAEVLEDRVEDLPYGQRRLLAVARAVAAQPSVLLLDECAAGLSEVESRELAVLVRRLADEWGMSIVLIEHDVNFVMSISDRIMVLDFGRKIADDAPEVIRADRHVIAAYLGESDEIVDTGSMG